MNQEELEAIRKRNEDRKNGDCGHTWGSGVEEYGICEHDHYYDVIPDIDALLDEVKRLRGVVQQVRQEFGGLKLWVSGSGPSTLRTTLGKYLGLDNDGPDEIMGNQ